MSGNRSNDYLEHIRQAAKNACTFIDGMRHEDFMTDTRTQQAVIMSLVIIGEAATKMMDRHPDYVTQHPDIPWRSMRGMRNRIAHGYFDINLNVVWQTVTTALPDLLASLPSPSLD